MMNSITEKQAQQVFIAELQLLRQWVAWRYRDRRDGKPSKQPVNPVTGHSADVSDPSTWSTFFEALGRQGKDDLAGVGFVLTAEDPYVAIDLDGCIDTSGNLAPWARDIVVTLDSYTEYSPSGSGLHLWTKGQLPAGRRRSGQIEMYCQARYMTVTLNPFGQRRVIEERTAALADLHQRYLQSASHSESRPSVNVPAILGDQEIVERILDSRVGSKFAQLWIGDISRYRSASEADLALASYIAFYTQDPQQVVRIASMSALCSRDKWHAKRGALTYGLMTAQKAVASLAATWDPNYRSAP